ncbi:MAG: hypothetical protein ACQKBV_00350 [Puniceicoccales bacterium]
MNKLLTVLIATIAFSQASASIEIRIFPDGTGFKVTADGTVNTTELNHVGTLPLETFIHADFGTFGIGTNNNDMEIYEGLTGPSNFGPGGIFDDYPDSSGNGFAIELASDLYMLLPRFYQSGAPLSAVNTYPFNNMSELGVTPGVYTWNWGTGANADFARLTVVPEPSFYSIIAGLAILGVVAHRRLRK